MGTFPRVTHPSATQSEDCVRLACVRPAASVRSEPGSNSQVEEINPGRTQSNQRKSIHHTNASTAPIQMMASRKKRRIRHYPNQYQIPIKSTQYPQGQRRPRFPFFLPNNVKEQKTTNPKEPAITATQKSANSQNPGKTNRDNPANTPEEAKPPKTLKKAGRRPDASVLRPGPGLVNQKKMRNFRSFFQRFFVETQMTTISRGLGKQGFLRVPWRPAMPIGLAIHAACRVQPTGFQA